MATRGRKIECVACGEDVRLYALQENDGVVIGCGCEDVGHSVDALPYEMGVSDLHDDWVRADIPESEVGKASPRYRDQALLTEAGE